MRGSLTDLILKHAQVEIRFKDLAGGVLDMPVSQL